MLLSFLQSSPITDEETMEMFEDQAGALLTDAMDAASNLMTTVEPTTFLGLQVGDMGDFYSLLIRMVLNFVVVGSIARFFYFPKSKRRDYLFIFIIMAMSIFLLVSLMEGSKMKTGAALGLFAIFGIIRYRTEAIPIREMTYLFMLVAVSVVNAMVTKMHWDNILSIVLANGVFVIMAAIFESKKLVNDACTKFIKYDNVSLVAPEKRAELIADLEKRTGLKIQRIEVGTIDFLKDSVLIRIFYDDPADKGSSIMNMARPPRG